MPTSPTSIAAKPAWGTSRIRAALTGLFVGSLLANSLPHLLLGITGQSHATPFGADSSAAANLIWGAANLALGLALSLFRGNRRHLGLFTATAVAGAAGTGASLAILWA